MTQLSSHLSAQPNTVPDDAAYASAVIAAVGAKAAYDFNKSRENLERLHAAEMTLRYVRDARQRAMARKAGMR